MLDEFFTYNDEFGEIDKDVLIAAQKIWRFGKKLSEKLICDEQKGHTLLMRAAANVSKRKADDDESVQHLCAYLFTSFRHLLIAEATKGKRRRELEENYFKNIEELFESRAESEESKICRKILVNEIEQRMDDWTRRVFRLRVLGYIYEDLVPQYGATSNKIRAKFSRNLQKLVRRFEDSA